MSKQVVLLHVGIDGGGIQGPLFQDGTFKFVRIPVGHNVRLKTCGKMLGSDGKRLTG